MSKDTKTWNALLQRCRDERRRQCGACLSSERSALRAYAKSSNKHACGYTVVLSDFLTCQAMPRNCHSAHLALARTKAASSPLARAVTLPKAAPAVGRNPPSEKTMLSLRVVCVCVYVSAAATGRCCRAYTRWLRHATACHTACHESQYGGSAPAPPSTARVGCTHLDARAP